MSDFDSLLSKTSAVESNSVDMSFLDNYRRRNQSKRDGKDLTEPEVPEPGESVEEPMVLPQDIASVAEQGVQRDSGQRGGSSSSSAPVEVEAQSGETQDGQDPLSHSAQPAPSATAIVEATGSPLEGVSAAPTHSVHLNEDMADAAIVDLGSAAKSAKKKKKKQSDADAALPRSGFSLPAERTNPQVRGMPERMVAMMRHRIKVSAIDVLGVSEQAALKFSNDLSIGALTTAALMAQFGVEFETDEATAVAYALYQQRDPYLASMVDQMQSLMDVASKQGELLGSLDKQVKDSKRTVEVLEHSTSFLVADRIENLTAGVYTAEDTPLDHRSVVVARDKAREVRRKRSQIEIAREGRPMR